MTVETTPVNDQSEIFDELARRYTATFNSGDVDAILGYYVDSAVTVVEPGLALAKSGELREALQGYLTAARPTVTFDYRQVYVAGDIALAITNWKISEVGPDGEETFQEGRAADVLTRGSDGSWKFVIDNRFGTT